MSIFLPVLLAGLAFEPFGPAPELLNLERNLKKEPAYQSKSPGYALLVFGNPIAAKVWMVHDGEKLYLDLNSNGDLTEPAKCFAAKKGPETDPADGCYYFEVDELKIAGQVHRNFVFLVRRVGDYGEDPLLTQALKSNPAFRGNYLSLDYSDTRWQNPDLGGRVRLIGTMRDPRGYLQLGKAPAEAPILHFGGPLQLLPDRHQELVAGREHELSLAIGTPGIGAGSTILLGYEGVIPQNAHPRVTLSFSSKEADKPSLESHATLTHRC